MDKISKNFKLAIDIIICFLIILQSIKKGGFYTSDIEFFLSGITFLAVIYVLFFTIKYVVDRNKDKDIKGKIYKLKDTALLLGVLSLAYLLPIIFNTYVNYEDSKFEFLRYLSIFILYIIIRNSVSKKIYYYTLMSIGLLQSFIGIEGLASRVLQPFLKMINSGYLSKDLTRLSGTIQYANTAAILIAISGILIIDKISEYIKKVKENNTKLNQLGLTVYFTLFTITTLSIILTSSRTVLFIYILTLIIYLFKVKSNKFNLLILIIVSFLISFLGSNNILDLVLTNTSRVYFVFLTYILLCIISIKYINKYIILNKDLSNKISKIKLNKTRFVIIVLSVLLIYLIVGLNVYKPLKLVKNKKENNITRQVYGVEKSEINNIDITVEENEVGSKYSIVVYEENNDYILVPIKRFEYFDNISNKFEFSFSSKEDTKRLNVSLICYEGSVSITEFKLNNNIKPLEYSLLPSDIVFRFIDSINGSTSLRDRIEYFKDSFKIWLTSPIFGTGGEGFRHLNKSVQTFNYTSTEAHNSILQVFAESGIIGGISICLVIYVVMKNNKYSILKLTFIMYIVHSLTDLNFSYFICLIVFSMLIGIMENKNDITNEIIKL